VWDQAVLNSYVPLKTPCILAASEAASNTLISSWGLKKIDAGHVPIVIAEPSGDPRPLEEMFPGLRPFLSEAGVSLEVFPCSDLRIEVSVNNEKVIQEKEFYVEGTKVNYLDSIDQETLLDLITNELSIGITYDQRDNILNQRLSLEKRERVRSVSSQESLADKLLTAIGTDNIRAHLPDALIPVAEHRMQRELTDVDLAQLAIDIWGVETLKEFRVELNARGMEPPSRFVGGKVERGWVRVLGFPPEYAGFETARRDPSLEIEGPPNLPALHEFQEKSVKKILSVLNDNDKDSNRGLLSLPTGAGKTRICVEALTRFAASKKPEGPILWVAQSDELCEQAVQSWSEIWREYGQPRERMQISRLWASNDATPFLEGIHVVVATIDKLQGCIYTEEYEWLDNVSCLVIDEAHSATTPSYTKLLQWQGLDRGRSRCPLIGLTATPYRGGTAETESLVRRFQAQRLEVVGEFGTNLYEGLQERGVLAKVEHDVLPGATVILSDEELKVIESLPENLRNRNLPASVLSRVGRDVTRTESLLKAIKAHPEDWPILVFASSVEHAMMMAGLLNAEGVTAAAITGHTDPAARRYYIQEFRAGRIRVLTNYGVLTAGFDAPQIRAVYVARPTYSRSLYQQMVGRGLRGPLNGGKELCLIVNVEDNIENYGAQLAFTEFEYLWRTGNEWEADHPESDLPSPTYGSDWTNDENNLITSSYFAMLESESGGQEYSKIDFINDMISQTGRTKGSVEFKYQNISAYLNENGFQYINGYKPAANYQQSLGQAVQKYLDANPALASKSQIIKL